MAMTVITISNAPTSLRGDLTKWMQEIATGVYIGNLNSRVRQELWERVTQSVGRGQATLSYAARNELGYQFTTHRTRQINVSFDGIPLVMIPQEDEHKSDGLKRGFSNEAKFHQARKYAAKGSKTPETPRMPHIIIDIETDGLDPMVNNIIEIAAVRADSDNYEEFHRLIRSEAKLPDEVAALTGMTDQLLATEGEDLSRVLADFVDFIGELPIVGYNLHFDVDFLDRHLRDMNKESIKNRKIDLLSLIKKEKMFLASYTLEDALSAYGIDDVVSHRALQDARLTHVLSTKVNEFAKRLNRKR